MSRFNLTVAGTVIFLALSTVMAGMSGAVQADNAAAVNLTNKATANDFVKTVMAGISGAAQTDTAATRTALKDGLAALTARDNEKALGIFKGLMDADACAAEGDSAPLCTYWTRLGLAFAYDGLNRKADSLPLYRMVADTPVPVANMQYMDIEQSTYRSNVRYAAKSTGEELLKNKSFDEAFRYFNQAYDLTVSIQPSEPRIMGSIVRGLASAARGKKNIAVAAGKVRPAYYDSPRDAAILAAYRGLVEQLNDKDELRNVDKFQGEVAAKLDKWEKLYAPNQYADANAVMKYNGDRAAVLRSAVKTAEKIGLKGYDDYLIREARAAQETVDSYYAKQKQDAEAARQQAENARQQAEYERQAAQARAEQDAADAALMNMFMNILTAPSY